jgi:hypothetical protein
MILGNADVDEIVDYNFDGSMDIIDILILSELVISG